jgi:murein DD-endopeptidase MepM/ murein hydrolase activator NlpD
VLLHLLLSVLLLAGSESADAQRVAGGDAERTRFARQMEELRIRDRRAWNRMPTLSPVADPVVTSAYGARRAHPVNRQVRPHYGLDLRARTGTQVRAAGEGRVASATRTGDYGFVIDLDHGNGYITRYAHASRLLVRTGEVVRRGQVIALSGATGVTSGPHLHLEYFHDGFSLDPCPMLIYRRIDDGPDPVPCPPS